MPLGGQAETWYVGIDPGKSGGMAAIGPGVVWATSMPATIRGILDWLGRLGTFNCLQCGASCNLAPAAPKVHVVMEKVGGYVRGGRGNVGSRMFEFGRSCGTLLTACEAVGLKVLEVAPTTWQQALGLSSRMTDGTKIEGADWKRHLKARAEALFPSVKVTLKTADALLLAEYCLRRARDTL